MYSKDQLSNPMELFITITRTQKSRIQTLSNDLLVSVHPIVKSYIQKELDETVNDYFERIYHIEKAQSQEGVQ